MLKNGNAILSSFILLSQKFESYSAAGDYPASGFLATCVPQRLRGSKTREAPFSGASHVGRRSIQDLFTANRFCRDCPLSVRGFPRRRIFQSERWRKPLHCGWRERARQSRRPQIPAHLGQGRAQE